MGQVLLVRHGQASFGTDDYDLLSTLGQEQGAAVGRALAGLRPDVVVHGGMRRQRQTAEAAVAAAGWDVPLVEDVRWNEFELRGSAERMATRDADGPRVFQEWYEKVMDLWIAGDTEVGEELHDAFTARTSAALDAVAGRRTAIVFTSGGPIASLTAGLVDGGPPAFAKLMPVMVNASITKVLSGRRGLSLVSYNAHDHLSREQVTYR